MLSPGDPLRMWADALCAAGDHGRNQEAELRHDLFLVLGPYLIDEVGVPNQAIQHERTSTAGRYDSLFGRALVEYKRPGLLGTDTERRRAARQAIEYLDDTLIGAEVVIVTDGRTWGILRDPSEGSTAGTQLAMDLGFRVEVDPIDRFQWRPNNPDTAERVLSLLASVRAIPVSSRSIISTLGLTRVESNELIAVLADALAEAEEGSRVAMLFAQWLELAGVAYGIACPQQEWPRGGRTGVLGDQLATTLDKSSFAEAVFVLHTFIALACKLIGAEVLAQLGGRLELRPSQWIGDTQAGFALSIEELEQGDLAEALAAPGLFAGDLFGWYAPLIREDPALEGALRRFFGSFSELAWAQLANSGGQAGDLLRDFYIATVPRPLRRALGEFFTPQWLAERVFGQAVRLIAKDERQLNTILDPACGSGTFAVLAFNFIAQRAQTSGASREKSLQCAIDSVTGFDINPISTLMTRVNLLLNLGAGADLLPEISFRVFQADSILLPEQVSGSVTFEQQDDVVRLPLVIGDLYLPAALSTIRGVHVLVRVLESSLQNERPADLFEANLRAELGRLDIDADAVERSIGPASVIYARLAALRREKRDGVWTHVIEQAFAPTLVGHVDLVVGNPPWISWKHTPQAWQDRSESLWRAFGLWQRRRRGGGVPLADLSTLLLARSIATYAPEGVVALLLPRGFLMADPGSRAIRQCRLVTSAEDMSGSSGTFDLRFAPLHVDDFSTLNPFPDAATTPIAVYVAPGGTAEFPVPSTRWTRSRRGARLPPQLAWRDATHLLTADDIDLAPLHAFDVGSIWVEGGREDALPALPQRIVPTYTWGQGFHTRGADGLYFCEILSESPDSAGLIRIRSLPDVGDNTRGEASRTGVVEAAYIWPLLRGDAVRRLAVVKPNVYTILPHDPAALTHPLSALELAERAPRLFAFLEPLIPRLAARSAYDLALSEERPFGIQGAFEYLAADKPYVVSRYISSEGRPPTAPVFPEMNTRLGRTTVPYFNNKSNFLQTDSSEEAWFVATFLSSQPCQDLIGRIASSTTISPGKLASIPIPRFDPEDARHRRIVKLGETSASPEGWDDHHDELDALVLAVGREYALSVIPG